MDFEAELTNINESWNQKKLGLEKKEIQRIAGKDYFAGKLLGAFSFSYANRSKLIKNSTVIYGYAFKCFITGEEDSAEHYPVWVLFSPSIILNKEPNKLKIVAEKLQKLDGKNLTKNLKKLYAKIHSNTADADYFKIPSEITGEDLIYLSITYLRKRLVPNFKLGLNLFLVNRAASKEILFLPTSYWSQQWAGFYNS